MINTYLIGGLAGVLSIIGFYIGFLKAKSNRLDQENKYMKRRNEALTKELDDAKKAKEIIENNRTLSGGDIDNQLQNNDWFRSDGNGM
ncbi:DUF2681 domain-containing protein [Otariodibacter oris]|uniref:Uncharacterized protein DUF2681 n=1 Tax=Otariodibacter oris TaxID=1032623 RepID=A0A420XIG8_9PAST|nr:DUF2681 domain-containing protein [Otariodibacter oris]QGM80675.1 hypothetical protein A6A10_04285 [Otariodibacter oris]RKR77164.1 uncharacterized protein DUF2681 [Otariodibacter oris]